ncbi:FapA family protein [Ruminococcaceae bacterium OttesenSCG-928-A11]|nr:FapA family protein [Ruminococcaceae bacterium OttesenSCG-928-A11]
MSDLTGVFNNGSKVVVSPDKMRAWVMLSKPAGAGYTAEAITAWLPEHGVVYGVDPALVRKAADTDRWDELIEVARGKAPVAASGGDYTLKIDKKPFTGLRAAGDGSLIYDDFSFLQEVEAHTVLAEIIPPVAAEAGMTVTGEAVPAREGSPGRVLEGSGFVVADEGRTYRAPSLSHVYLVNDKLVVTPLSKVKSLSEADGELAFMGNVLVEGDVTAGAKFSASGSIFVAGRAVSCTIKAGNNVLLAGGMRSDGAFGTVEAAENVWGLFFESCNITAGGDLCANHLTGCEATCGGRANILGGRASIESTNLTATGGVVAGVLGSPSGSEVVIRCGLGQDFLDRTATVAKKIDKLGIDIQALQQNITAHERVNKMKADKGRNDPAYKEMVAKRNQSLSVLNIMNNERTRLKRTADSFAGLAVIARDTAYAGVNLFIDARRFELKTTMKRTKFRRNGEVIEAIEIGASGR